MCWSSISRSTNNSCASDASRRHGDPDTRRHDVDRTTGVVAARAHLLLHHSPLSARAAPGSHQPLRLRHGEPSAKPVVAGFEQETLW